MGDLRCAEKDLVIILTNVLILVLSLTMIFLKLKFENPQQARPVLCMTFDELLRSNFPLYLMLL
ncbi:hypothetical protein LWM68_38790 [Niabella sp. W65]|nr:hypothetical protein [Niabella sp. W65]MCH7368161.1 hypothetical protein [Niabella sp. W65]ULT43777.1 hypothetical protein KRR40_10470 [Niabella sp. I65]